MKYFLIIIMFTLIVLSAPVGAIAQQNQTNNTPTSSTGNTNSARTSPTPTDGQQNGNSLQTQTQNQTSNQGEDSQLKINESVQTALSQNKVTYSTSNEIFKKNLDDTVTSAGKLINISEQVALQNPNLATQLQQIAKQQVASTQQAVQSLDKANSKNAVMKLLFGTDFSQIKNAKEQMEQNRNRIQILNQVKAQVENSGIQSELQAQIQILEAQNTALQQNIDDVVGSFSLLGWLFNWLNK